MVAVRLRPSPDRETAVAAGAVSLALAALVIDLRMTQWSLGPRFLVLAAITSLILALGWSAEPGGTVARPYKSTLMISGLLLLPFAMQLLAEVLGAHRAPGAGGTFWTFAAVAAVAFASARRANSAGCTLIGGLAVAISFLAFISFAFHPHGLTTFRWMMLLESVAFAIVAVRLRVAHARHATQIMNVAGLVVLLLAFTFLATTLISATEARLGTTTPIGNVGPAGFGWKLYVLVAAGGLLSFSVLNRAPAPGVLGILVSFTFVVLVGFPSLTGGSLVFWPLFLLIVGAAGVLMGLGVGRPTARGVPPAPTVPPASEVPPPPAPGPPPPPAPGPPPPPPAAEPPQPPPGPPASEPPAPTTEPVPPPSPPTEFEPE